MEIAVQMLLKEIWLVLGFVFIIVNNVALASIDEHFQPLIPKPNSYKKIEEYEYILPQRKVTSCPSFASFKFACETNHLISIDSLVFAPTMGGDLASGTTAATKVGECESDWRAECHDDSGAFEYAARECSSREQCSLISYQLRSRTKCAQHQVVSIFYKCIPSWEITTVPIKCDICKNVTVNSIKDNFGFIHSAWYPKLYPRVTCHSLIQNRPEHFIVVYSVSGSIGLDRILIESLDNGARPMREILTGNLTTRLVITSANDVNITVLTEDTYYFEQRRFLLYFYIVPKCYIILCSNVTGYPQIGYYPTTTRPQSVEYYNSNYPAATTLTYASPTGLGYNPTTSSSISSQPSPPSAYSTYSSSSSSYYSSASSSYVPQPPPPAAPLPPASYGPQSTYAPPLIADYHNNKHHSKISDAWLAAILALIYALLMVFAVLVAIYCRRRRRRRLVQENNIHIFSPSCVSSSHMLNNPSATITRSMTQSQISIHDHSIPSGYLTTSASYGSGAVIGIPQLCGAGMIAQGSEHNMIYSQVNNNSRRGDDMLEYTTGTSGSMPTYQRQLNVNTSTEFDNYSQVLSDDYEEEEMSCDAMNYGDIDVTNQFTHLHHPHHHALYSRSGHAVAAARCYQNLDAMTTGPITDSPPYSLKTNTQHGQILACSNAAPGNLYSAAGCNKDYSNKNMYRAVEYTKGPQMETVRVHNSHDNDCFNTNGEQIVDEIHTTTTTTTTTRYEEYLQKYDDLNATTSIVSPAKVTTTESVTYRRDANGDLLEETMTTTTAGVDPPPGSPAQGALALPPHQPKTIIESGCSEPYTSITTANNNNHRSSSFVVKLYPSDEQEKEVQEMTMYVESPNATVATSTSYKSF